MNVDVKEFETTKIWRDWKKFFLLLVFPIIFKEEGEEHNTYFLRDWNHILYFDYILSLSISFVPLLKRSFGCGGSVVLVSVFFATCALLDVALFEFDFVSDFGRFQKPYKYNCTQTNNRINKIYDFCHLNFFSRFSIFCKIESNWSNVWWFFISSFFIQSNGILFECFPNDITYISYRTDKCFSSSLCLRVCAVCTSKWIDYRFAIKWFLFACAVFFNRGVINRSETAIVYM